MGLFGNKDGGCRLQVLLLDHVIEGTADISGQNLNRFTFLTDVTARSVNGSPPGPRGTTWAIGEDTGALIGMVPLDDAAHEELLSRATKGKHELLADVYTGPYVVRGTLLAFDDDPKVLVNAGALALRDAEIESIAPGSTLGTWQAPLVLLYMNHLQGLVLAG